MLRDASVLMNTTLSEEFTLWKRHRTRMLLYTTPWVRESSEEAFMGIQGKPGRISRRAFLSMGGASAAALMLGQLEGPLHVLGARAARGATPARTTGYGPLVPKGDLALPAEFNYKIISVQAQPQRDGTPTPGIFDGMGAFSDTGGGVNPTADTTILIRYDEDPTYTAGCTKLVVRQTRSTNKRGQEVRTYEVLDSFNIIGGTDTNCAGGVTP